MTTQSTVDDYPTACTFRVIGRTSETLVVRIHRLVCRIVGELRDDDVITRPSSAGTYTSIAVNCVVESETQRQQIYDALKADPEVMMLL